LEAHYFDPAGRQIEPNASRLASMRVHLLNTNCGRVDVLRTVGKDLAYPDLVERSRELDVAELRVRVLDLEAIIETKEHADRPKDRYQLLFLRQLLAEIQRLGTE
jgi:predicted nucleotidyltransferase